MCVGAAKNNNFGQRGCGFWFCGGCWCGCVAVWLGAGATVAARARAVGWGGGRARGMLCRTAVAAKAACMSGGGRGVFARLQWWWDLILSWLA